MSVAIYKLDDHVVRAADHRRERQGQGGAEPGREPESAAHPEYWQRIIKGIIIVTAVSVDLRKYLRKR
ncbi:hypothetical protein BE04_09250 [Sorangium cellulosum]|uniref:Uncharacterized protein n=1 Tax=Sorangium cellulosum TaxID=56 RepID=A0A150TDU9_SORCE|nr:hypothetical protein [Sorangium cellulosum]KYF63259.1 hypothetical protein BE04_09250 [Sorangium cellulosum]KYG02875.1 hypothetical protein BE21_04910 [Sorangium cellulosum]